MGRRSVIHWTLATLALLGARAASADPITFTGVAGTDFNPNTNPNVQVFSIEGDPLNNIYEPQSMVSKGIITGWAVKDLRLAYDANTHTMSVGVNTYFIAGDADGNGNPGTVDPAVLKEVPSFQDLPHLGGTKSITVAFATNNPSDPSQNGKVLNGFVAGVPSDKSTQGQGIDGFTVASYANKGGGIENNYGATLAGHVGTLAFDPSAQHPHLEFTIPNFNTIPGFDPANGFWVKVYAGDPYDSGVGETSYQWIHVPKFAAESIPEPTTWLAWTLLGGGALWRRSRKMSR